MRILFIGDIVGRPGRDMVRHGLAAIVDHHAVDLVIANAENAAAGFGITREIGDQLLDSRGVERPDDKPRRHRVFRPGFGVGAPIARPTAVICMR